MEEETKNPSKKTYLEAALTPVSSPCLGSTPSPFMVGKKEEKTGIIDTRLKWYLNDYNPDETCSKCKRGIEDIEWNSYYTVYVKRYKDIMNDYKVKIYNDRDTCDNSVYCDLCKRDITDKFMEDKKQKQVRLPFSTPMLEAISKDGGIPPITINTPMLEALKSSETMPSLNI